MITDWQGVTRRVNAGAGWQKAFPVFIRWVAEDVATNAVNPCCTLQLLYSQSCSCIYRAWAAAQEEVLPNTSGNESCFWTCPGLKPRFYIHWQEMFSKVSREGLLLTRAL